MYEEGFEIKQKIVNVLNELPYGKTHAEYLSSLVS